MFLHKYWLLILKIKHKISIVKGILDLAFTLQRIISPLILNIKCNAMHMRCNIVKCVIVCICICKSQRNVYNIHICIKIKTIPTNVDCTISIIVCIHF